MACAMLPTPTNALRNRLMTEINQQPLLLEVKDLQTHFHLREGLVRAVDGISFNIHYGQTVGVVGESGCGKSMTARSLLRIEPRGAKVSGQILLHRQVEGQPKGQTDVIDLAQLDPTGSEIRKIRGEEIAMIFQEPMSSFSPVHTIGNQIMEAISLHQNVNEAESRKRAIHTLEIVGMPRPERTIDRFPHQLSGGMRQRAMIAMGLSCRPALLIADEPTTALDVTTQAQILKLMRELQKEFGMAIMFITHDLGVIAQVTKYVVVMYMGKVVEAGPVVDLFHNPQHPYTQSLLRSIPSLTRKLDRLAVIPGSVPDPFNLPAGCRFHPRCAFAIPGVCDVAEPPDVQVKPDHTARCVMAKPSTAPAAAAHE
jgi:peptide/nickel transport system ATP-binding protein